MALIEISASLPDWTREQKTFFEWAPSRSLLLSIRSYQKNSQLGNPFKKLLAMVAVIRHRFWGVITGAEIPINTMIGGGLLIPHPNGIVIHSNARIGPNCLIFQQVTIGVREKETPPIVGGHVDIGAGAKLLGAIKIGNHAKIGANAVVLLDVPDNRSAMGIPAKLL